MEKKRRVGPTWKYRLSTHCDRGEGYAHWHTHLRMKCSSVPRNISHKILTKMFNPRNSMLHMYCSSCQPPSPLQQAGVHFSALAVSHCLLLLSSIHFPYCFLFLQCLLFTSPLPLNQMFFCSLSPFQFSQGFAGSDSLKVTSLPF